MTIWRTMSAGSWKRWQEKILTRKGYTRDYEEN